MGYTEIRPDKLKAALDGIPADTPFLMLNMLKFNEKANYEGQESDLTGREAYGIYGKQARGYLAKIGAEVVIAGPALGTAIGPTEEDWDVVMFVRYPSSAAFLALANDPEYAEIATHRRAALADSRLIPVVA